MQINYTILLVEDEEESADMLQNFLEMNEYRVLLAHDGQEAINIIDEQANEIHLALLDIMVPNVDGKELCKYIREHPIIKNIPVIFLTAKDKEKDEIEGLEVGADDYIAKPVRLNLVKAHLETQLRRRKPDNVQWLHYGNVYMDTEAKEIYVNNEKIELTSTEFYLLELFFRNPRMVFSRQDILEHISGEDKFVFDRTVDVHIKNLRLKLKEGGDIIKTYRGMGYGLNRELADI